MPKEYIPLFLAVLAVPGFPMSKSEGKSYLLQGGEPKNGQLVKSYVTYLIAEP